MVPYTGENIAAEIRDVCLKAKPKLRVYRAKFSAVTQRDVQRACNSLVPIDDLYVAKKRVEATPRHISEKCILVLGGYY